MTPQTLFNLMLVTMILIAILMVFSAIYSADGDQAKRAFGKMTVAVILILAATALNFTSSATGRIGTPSRSDGTIADASPAKANHEIGNAEYSALAMQLEQRPSLNALLTSARADGVITNDELTRYDASVAQRDRRVALGNR